MKKTITWKKYVNSFNPNISQFISEKDNANSHGEEVVFDEEDGSESSHANSIPVALTPLGIVPILPFNNADEVFDWWMGITTFRLSDKDGGIIEFTDGVEEFTPFSDYRFRVAIAQTFDEKEVKSDIEKRLGVSKEDLTGNKMKNMILDQMKSMEVNTIIKKCQNFKYYSVYVCPNGKIDYCISDEKNENFDEKAKVHQEAQKVAGGSVYTK